MLFTTEEIVEDLGDLHIERAEQLRLPAGLELNLPPWHQEHDQGSEGACVGFGTSMALWILNREESKRAGIPFDVDTRYDPWWLWREARLADEWPGNDDFSVSEGTYVRAACDVLRVRGHCMLKRR